MTLIASVTFVVNTKLDNRKSITGFVRKAYFAYFGIKLGDQDKPWAPCVICKTCVERLWQWTSRTRQSMGFGIPMVWREPRNHVDDWYFCSINVTGVNKNKCKFLSNRSFPSAIRSVAHGADIPMPEFKIYPLMKIQKKNNRITESLLMSMMMMTKILCVLLFQYYLTGRVWVTW